MALYSDNKNRATRVNELCADIARLQVDLKQAVDDANRTDQRSLAKLTEMAKKAGYKSLDEYVKAGMALLTQEERAAMEKMTDDVAKLDGDMETSHLVFRGMIAAGIVLTGGKLASFGIELESTQALIFGIQSILRGVYRAIATGIETAVKFFSFGKVTLNLVTKMPTILKDGAKAVEFAKRGGNVLIGLGVLLDGAALIAEAIIGADQRAKLREAIKHSCAHRFITKTLTLQAKVMYEYHQNLHGFAMTAKKQQDKLSSNEETKDGAAKVIGEKLNIVKDLESELSKLAPQKTFDELGEADKNANAWTNEDPSFSDIDKYVREHPQMTGKK